MRVLVFEPKFVGHFLGFAAAAARAFASAGHAVDLVLSSHAEGSTPAEIKLVDLPDSVRVEFTSDTPKLYQKRINGRLESEALATAIDRYQPDWLVVPSADFLIAGLFYRPWLRKRLRGLKGADFVLHNCRQAYPEPAARELVTHWIDRAMISAVGWARLHTVDEYAVSSEAPGSIGLWGAPPRWLPHFYDRGLDRVDPSEARQRLGLAEDCRWIGSVGDLGRRKGTVLLIDSFAATQPTEATRLALFGKLCEASRAALKRHADLVDRGIIHLNDRFVSEQEFLDFFPAVDVVWAGYPWQIGIASTLLFAADARRPVVGIDYGSVGWTVRQYGLGTVCSRDPQAITGAIRSALGPDAAEPHPEGVERLLTSNCTARFNEALTEGVRAASTQGER